MLLYFFGEMCRNLYRSKLVTSISVITIGILLFFLICFSLVMINVHKWINDNQNRPQMSVYFSVNLSVRQEDDLVRKIVSVAGAKNTKFISRAESYDIFLSLYGSEMLSAVDENPFPAVLELGFTNDFSEENIINLSRDR